MCIVRTTFPYLKIGVKYCAEISFVTSATYAMHFRQVMDVIHLRIAPAHPLPVSQELLEPFPEIRSCPKIWCMDWNLLSCSLYIMSCVGYICDPLIGMRRVAGRIVTKFDA